MKQERNYQATGVSSDSYVAVPVKPTMPMLAAALRAGAESAGVAFAVFQAMVDAAPELEETPAPPPVPMRRW